MKEAYGTWGDELARGFGRASEEFVTRWTAAGQTWREDLGRATEKIEEASAELSRVRETISGEVLARHQEHLEAVIGVTRSIEESTARVQAELAGLPETQKKGFGLVIQSVSEQLGELVRLERERGEAQTERIEEAGTGLSNATRTLDASLGAFAERLDALTGSFERSGAMRDPRAAEQSKALESAASQASGAIRSVEARAGEVTAE